MKRRQPIAAAGREANRLIAAPPVETRHARRDGSGVSVVLCTLTAWTSPVRKVERMMTALGAVVYGGFFLLAALWLVVTGDYDSPDDVEAGQPQERSNSTSASVW